MDLLSFFVFHIMDVGGAEWFTTSPVALSGIVTAIVDAY